MVMKARALIGVAFAMFLVGCQTPGQISPGRIWSPLVGKDEFSDKVTKMVTVGMVRSNSMVITQSLRYYPFVGVQDGELYVGIRSGGGYRIPTGTVQIRVDENPSWTITPEETPVYLSPSMPPAPTGMASNQEMADMIQKTQNQVMGNVAKIMSPYTAATGEKAKAIIKEMIRGRVIKYRTIGFNQAASSTGEVQIDDSFFSSLRGIGIAPERL
ncbi:hypothetical protein [Propionivibrio sp.]|uniref:hypothetical protein n=1 Tax=Propionivibrio sp. TaxID=2212460 RepID=UPI0039E3861B